MLVLHVHNLLAHLAVLLLLARLHCPLVHQAQRVCRLQLHLAHRLHLALVHRLALLLLVVLVCPLVLRLALALQALVQLRLQVQRVHQVRYHLQLSFTPYWLTSWAIRIVKLIKRLWYLITLQTVTV